MKRQTERENTRTNGAPIWTGLSTLPERFTHGPHTKAMGEYLARRWSAHSCGWYARTGKAIEYNREFTPHDANDKPRYRADDRRFRWVEHPANGLRLIGKAHEIRGNNCPWYRDDAQSWERSLIDNTGWFVDNYQDETVCGEVYQIPARDGRPQYVPAIQDQNGNDGAVLDFHSITDDLRDAIRWADSMAKRFAEDEREYQAKDQAAARIEEIEGEINTARADFKALAKEIRANCDKLTGLSELSKLIRREYRSMRATCRSLAQEKGKLKDDYWTAVPNGY